MTSGSIDRRLTIASLIFGASVLLSRILGFVRDAVIAYLLGAGRDTDAYFAAFTIPDLMNYLLSGGALSITFIPLYGRFVADEDEDRANHLVSVVATTLGSAMVGFILLGELFARPLVEPVFPGFDADQLDLTANLTRIVLPGQLFFVIGGILSATLMVRERFVPVALVPLVYNLSIILFGVVLTPFIGVAGFSVGALVGSIVGAFLIPFWFARRSLRFRPRLSFLDPLFVRYVKLSLPLMLGVTLLTAGEWIERYFGSSLESGTITWFNNARRLMLVPYALIGQAAAQAALPFLTRLVAESRHEELRRTLTGTLRAMLFLSALAAVFLGIVSERAVTAIYERGLWTPHDSLQTAPILLFFCPAVVAWATQTVAVRGFYAHADTIRPMIVGTVVTLGSLPLYALLAHRMAGPGLALATSLGLTLNAILTISVYQRRYGGVGVGQLLASLGRGLVVAAVAGLPVYALDRFLGESLAGLSRTASAWIVLAITGVAYATAVALAAHVIGGDEGMAVRRLTRRLGRIGRRGDENRE